MLLSFFILGTSLVSYINVTKLYKMDYTCSNYIHKKLIVV